MSSLDAVRVNIRQGRAEDLRQVAAIQEASPEASQWNPADYLTRNFLVAVDTGAVDRGEHGAIAGFAVTRRTAPDEMELLNLAVAPRFRRRGIGRRLVESLGIARFDAAGKGRNSPETEVAFCVFLEVRESNGAAREFYKSLGFQEVSVRRNYYHLPAESAIVMKFHSC
jgi:ribosomal-protein-alanine N-acetyltransferase